MVYQFKCQTCLESGEKEAVYYGESSRTPYERGLEHQKLIDAGSIESPMVEYQEENRQEEPIKFNMEVISQEPRPLHRKTLEGVLISEHKGGALLNRKGE